MLLSVFGLLAFQFRGPGQRGGRREELRGLTLSLKREGLGPKAEGVVCVITLGEKIMLTGTPVTT